MRDILEFLDQDMAEWAQHIDLFGIVRGPPDHVFEVDPSAKPLPLFAEGGLAARAEFHL